MEYKIPVSKETIYKVKLSILNFNLGLSDLEIDIISTMLNNNITIVNTDCRDLIRKVLDKDKFVTNNYINKLKAKGILEVIPNTKNLQLNKSLVFAVRDNTIMFDFELI